MQVSPPSFPLSHTHSHTSTHNVEIENCYGLPDDCNQNRQTFFPSGQRDSPQTARSAPQQNARRLLCPPMLESAGGCWDKRTSWPALSRHESIDPSRRFRGCPRCWTIPPRHRYFGAGPAGGWAGLEKPTALVRMLTPWFLVGRKWCRAPYSTAQKELVSVHTCNIF